MKKFTILILLLCTLSAIAEEKADYVRSYSTERPLIYEDAWDLWPYVFLNESGEPDGYNVDLLKLIFKELDIPYIIKLKPTLEAQKDLQEGRSDLMLRMDASFSRGNSSYSKSIVQLFTHSIVSPKGKGLTIRNEHDLAGHTIIVHEGSFSHHYIKDHNLAKEIESYNDMKEATQKVSAKREGIILWNTMSLKWLLWRYHLDNLEITPIDLPYGEYKFMSKDLNLLARIDSVFSALRATERLQPIQNKWFYPNRKETGIPSWIWQLISALALFAVLVLGYYIFYRLQERKMTRNVQRNNERLTLIMRTSRVRFWTYHVATQIFTVMDQHGKPQREYSSLEFSRRYSADDFLHLNQALKQVIEDKVHTIALDIRSRQDDGEERDYSIKLSVFQRDKDKKPTVIICSGNDMTDEHTRMQKIQDTKLRYQSIFETAMVDMVYYDSNGILYDLNDKACETFGTNRKELLAKRISIADVTGIHDLQADALDYFYATQIIPPDEEGYNGKLWRRKEKSYYEQQLIPVHDDDGQLLGIYGTGRDITEVANSYHQQQENIKLLQEANDEVRGYIQNIDYAMSVGGIRIGRYQPATHTLTIYREAESPEFTLTQTRLLALVHEQSRKLVQQALHSMDNQTATVIHADVKTILRKNGFPLYLQFHFIPLHEGTHGVNEYFGVCRDISELKSAEAKLAEETLRAQEVEVIKNAFLRNMSYEIRTPLNTVVGFSELFEMEHSEEDEAVFIHEIKTNSDKLLQLINDILFISRLDADMVAITPAPIDFAAVFDGKCESAWASDRKPGVEYVVQNPYKRLIIDIDDTNFSIILEKIIKNAIQHTASGKVLARYDYIGDRLVVSIEDNGSGIPESLQKHIFERFVTGGDMGTGLGLSICHELTQRMGGAIRLKSIEDKGTTVWFSIPCKASEIERK